MLTLLDRLEQTRLSARLLLGWVVCALPRAAISGAVGLGEDYGFFVHGRTDAAWYPLYEVLARVLWRLSGEHIGPYFAFHLVIHATLGPIVYGLAKQLGLGARTAWLSVAGVALMPYYASLSARQPQVGVTVVLFALLLLVFASRGAGPWLAVVSVLVVTLRPNAISVIAVLYAIAWMRAKRASVLVSAATFASLLVALATINLYREGRFSPFTGNIGFNLYIGNNPKLDEYAWRYDITSLQDTLDEALPAGYADTPVEQRDRLLLRTALDYIAAHPWRSVWHAVLKSWRYWDPLLEDARLTALHWNLAYTVPYLVYALLAIPGAVVLWRRGPRTAFTVIVATLIAYWLPHAVLYGAVRMRMTGEFLLILLASHAVAHWASRAAPLPRSR